MPSYTEEQKRRAAKMVEECGGSATRAMRRLGYPTRQTLYHWLNRRDESHERRLCFATLFFRFSQHIFFGFHVFRQRRASDFPSLRICPS